MVKGVVFDMDHTLYDRYGTLCILAKELRDIFPIKDEVSDAEVTKCWIECDKRNVHYGLKKMYTELIATGIFADPVPTVEQLIENHGNGFGKVAVPYDFAIPTVNELKSRGLKVGLITNGSSQVQRSKLKMLGFEGLFDHVIVCGELGVEKPELLPFEEMSRVLDIPPSQLMYVGDHPLNDVDASRRAGYIPVWVRTTGSWEFPELPLPRHRINAVYELLEYDFNTAEA